MSPYTMAAGVKGQWKPVKMGLLDFTGLLRSHPSHTHTLLGFLVASLLSCQTGEPGSALQKVRTVEKKSHFIIPIINNFFCYVY